MASFTDAVFLKTLKHLDGPKAVLHTACDASDKALPELLFDQSLPLEVLKQFSESIYDAVSRSKGQVLPTPPNLGLDERGREASGPVKISGNIDSLHIKILDGGVIQSKAFKTLISWMLDSCEGGGVAQLSKALTFTDLVDVMAAATILRTPKPFLNQITRNMNDLLHGESALDEIEEFFEDNGKNHPAHNHVIEYISKAFADNMLQTPDKCQDCLIHYGCIGEVLERVGDFRVSSTGDDGWASSADPKACTLDDGWKEFSEGPDNWNNRGKSEDFQEASISWPADSGTYQDTHESKRDKKEKGPRLTQEITDKSWGEEAGGWGEEVQPQLTADLGDFLGGAAGFNDNITSDETNVNDGWGNTTATVGDDGFAGASSGQEDQPRSDPRTCRKCNQLGHFAKDCPENACFNCMKTGHKARDCTEPSSETCRKCKQLGHHARDCTTELVCFTCNQPGHFSRECAAGKEIACFNCGTHGHIQRDCPNGGAARARGRKGYAAGDGSRGGKRANNYLLESATSGGWENPHIGLAHPTDDNGPEFGTTYHNKEVASQSKGSGWAGKDDEGDRQGRGGNSQPQAAHDINHLSADTGPELTDDSIADGSLTVKRKAKRGKPAMFDMTRFLRYDVSSSSPASRGGRT